MNVILIIVGIIAIMWVLGKIVWSVQDNNEMDINPNHPSKLSKSAFPIGSGACPSRNGDRHIWDYGSYEDDLGPHNRFCKHCGKYEHRMFTTGEWKDF
jgi:hypothetical protein